MILSVHQPQYLPWIGYFDKIDRSDGFVFLDNVQYKAREFQNRNRIRMKDGPIWLTVPVISKGMGRQNIRDVEIDNERTWYSDHLKSITAAYTKTAHFEEYSEFFHQTLAPGWQKLLDLNIEVTKYLLGALKIDTPIYYESALDIHTMSTDRIVDICKQLKADAYLSGIGGKDYLEEDKFKDAGIELMYQEFQHPVYTQHFVDDTHPFEPYMSVIDLLFNEGPNSLNIIRGQSSNV